MSLQQQYEEFVTEYSAMFENSAFDSQKLVELSTNSCSPSLDELLDFNSKWRLLCRSLVHLDPPANATALDIFACYYVLRMHCVRNLNLLRAIAVDAVSKK